MTKTGGEHAGFVERLRGLKVYSRTLTGFSCEIPVEKDSDIFGVVSQKGTSPHGSQQGRKVLIAAAVCATKGGCYATCNGSGRFCGGMSGGDPGLGRVVLRGHGGYPGEDHLQVWNANGWAASPAVIEAVLAQNKKGPIVGMNNAKWKVTPKSDAIVQDFINNDIGQFFKTEIAKTEGICIRAFLNATQGEEVAFTDKPGSYIHKGAPNFDAPFARGKTWQGKPELENRIYVIQIAVPVLSEGKPIGILAADINGTKLEELSKQ